MKTLNALCDLTDRRIIRTGLLVLVYLAFIGCAQFQHNLPETLPFMDRTQTKTDGEVRVTAAVPSAEESQQIFGFPLAGKNIQPVWLEVENNSDNAFFLHHLAMDPDIYSSGEVAWKFQSSLFSKNSQKNIYNLFRDNEIDWFFKPGTTTSGFVYTNLKMGTKAVLVRLFAEKKVREISFFIEVPGLRADHHQLDPYTLYTEKDMIDLDDDGLRQALKNLPCCLTNKDGSGESDPINIIVIGQEEEIWPAFITRGWDEAEVIYGASLGRTIASSVFGIRYRYSPMSALYFYGRPQDVSLQKARQTVDERNHLRLWLSPMRYQGMPVYIGQISRDIGVKLTTKSPTLTTHEIDPDVDEARDYLMLDLLESQKVAKIGFVEGVGSATPDHPRYNLTDSPYWTNGLRVVFVFSESQTALDEVEVFDWERIYQNMNNKSVSEKGIIEELPKIGEIVSSERAITLCENYGFSHLTERIEDNPDLFREWEFDGCSMTPTDVLSELIKVPSLTEICLRHDLGYAYGDPGNEEERIKVDTKFQNELIDGGASEFAAKAMYNAVRIGGKEELCLPFSWGFARVAPCKPGVGLNLKQ